MYDAVHAERLGIPTATLVNTGFAHDARSAASGKGMPNVRILVEQVPCECTIPEQIVANTSAMIEEVVGALTRPLAEEERSPQPREIEPPARIVFKGDFQEVDHFYYKRGWTDGLPVVPPTDAAVREMLTGTDLPPDHVVAQLIPRMGKATVERIAINAVMAGCLPTYMPILIAGVQALVDPVAWFGTWEVSTGSWVPFWIVNGPIRNQLNINGGSGALSPGDIANAAIGRAMGLIVKNVGGARKGIEDMGVLGNPGKYSMVVGENEELSPWEPLSVDQGFAREDNCVTVTFPNSFPQVWLYGTDEKGILRGIVSNVIPWLRAMTLVMIPSHAQTLAAAGWTKQGVMDYICEYARVPAYRHQRYWEHRGPIAGHHSHPYAGGPYEPAFPAINAEDPVRMLDTDHFRIVVAGGPGMFAGLFGGGGNQQFVTKKIDLPANWESLARKYRDWVPNHVRY